MFSVKKTTLPQVGCFQLFRKAGLNFFIFLFACSVTLGQTNYYVSSAGNDNNNGTSPATAFQSINRINNQYLQPGDSVLFRRGDTFRGSLVIRQYGAAGRPIVFAAYGSGAKPTLSGSVPVTNWTNIGGNVWQAACSSCGSSVTGLYKNGAPLPLGRYPNADAPNKGYLTIRAHTDKYQIFSQEPLPDNLDFNGGEVVIRATQWILDRATIDHEYHPDVLNLSYYNSNYGLSDGWGYFIQNHPATLDQEGEWHYDANSKAVRIFAAQTNPNSQTITATVQSRVIDAINVAYITFRNLHIAESLNQNVLAINASNLALLDNDITGSGEDGVSIQGASNNLTMTNNQIIDVNNNGVYVDGIQNFTFRGNTLRRVGVIPGRGKGGDGQYNGLQSNANQNVLIENNIVDSIGYNGISFWNNTTIRQNVISNYCLTKSDGGGLYVFNSQKAQMTNIHLVSNIIYNGIGAPEGSFRKEYSGANGIFLDDCVTNVEAKNNTVFNNHQWGIYLHATSFVSAIGNTSFNNRVSQFVMYNDAGYCPFRNNVVKNNVNVSKIASQLTGQYESDTDDLLLYGAIDSNYYANPFNEDASIQGFINYGQGGQFNLNKWKIFSKGLDLNSKSSPITYQQYKSDGAGGTNRFNSTFDIDSENWDLVYSNYNNAAVARDNTNKLDGSSLRVSFITPSGQKDSYAQAIKRFGLIKKGQTYVLRFDAIASVNVNVLVYLRTYGPPYKEYDKRYTVALSTSRTSYELPFTSTDDGTDAIVMVQIDGEGPTFWLDNVRLQEGVPIRNNENDFINLYYNSTLKDSVIFLPSGNYRDVKNQLYKNSFVLKPFTSVILLKDTVAVSSADLSLLMQCPKRVLQVNEPTTLQIRVINQSNTTASLARWTYRLPANLQFTNVNGQPYSDNVLTGTVQQLPPLTDTTFIVSVRPTTEGLFRMSAQLTTATSPDPDSQPNTGVGDGQDDAALAELRVGDPTTAVFESPNPNQRLLPLPISDQPTPVPNQADLSIRMDVSHRAPIVGEIITCTLYVDNAGGSGATGIQLQNLLPDGFTLVSATNWVATGRTLTTTLPAVAAGATVSASFQVRVTLPGIQINQAQIYTSSVADPDSIPGNGFTNGEDDQVQTDVRSQ